MASVNDLKKNLVLASKIAGSAERAVTIAAIIAEALRTIGQEPILVGGAAVEFYTQGGYTTADIDMVAEGGPGLIQIMEELGFKKLGKDFENRALRIYVEFPGRSLKPSERSDRIKVASRELKIISIEDLIVDRLASFKYWQSAIDGLNAMKLIETGKAVPERVRQRSKEEKVNDALEVVEEVREEVIRKKLSPQAANRLLEKKMQGLK